MKKVYLFLADGFEEIEGLAAVDILRRAGIEVVTVSIMGQKTINGSHAIRVEADCCYQEADQSSGHFSDGDMLVLPGGGKGAERLASDAALCEVIKAYEKAGKYLAAICAAPSVFGRMGLMKGRKCTCYPGFEEKMLGAMPVAASVVQDGLFITGRGMGASVAFALKLVEVLDSKAAADKIGAAIQDENYLK